MSSEHTHKAELTKATPPAKEPHPYESAEKPWNTAQSVADKGQLPREVKPLDRAIDGTKRVKVQATGHPVMYVLVEEGRETDAVPFYTKQLGLMDGQARITAKVLVD